MLFFLVLTHSQYKWPQWLKTKCPLRQSIPTGPIVIWSIHKHYITFVYFKSTEFPYTTNPTTLSFHRCVVGVFFLFCLLAVRRYTITKLIVYATHQKVHPINPIDVSASSAISCGSNRLNFTQHYCSARIATFKTLKSWSSNRTWSTIYNTNAYLLSLSQNLDCSHSISQQQHLIKSKI